MVWDAGVKIGYWLLALKQPLASLHHSREIFFLFLVARDPSLGKPTANGQ
jgi:hypothetical protein